MRPSMEGRPMTEAYLDRELSDEEFTWSVRLAHRFLAQAALLRTTPLDALVVPPKGRARKPEVKPGLARPDHVQGTVPSVWLAVPADAVPSYDLVQEAKAKSLVSQELREMDVTW